MILLPKPTKIHTSYSLKLSERPIKVKRFPFALIFAEINQKFVFFTKIFKLVFCTLLLGQVSSLGGIANTTFGE